MKIKEIISQSRRDFTAMMICEHCSNEYILKDGYDDDFYHEKVIPNMECSKCNKKSPEDYQPKETKYSADQVI